MKSLATVLALGMFAAVQLVGSAPGQAQSSAVPNSLGLQTSATSLLGGQTFDIKGLMTSGQNDTGRAGNIVNVSAVLVYDASVFQPLGFTPAKDSSNNGLWDLLNTTVMGTFTVTGNPDKDGTYSYIAYNGGRTTSGKPDLTGTDLLYGTFQFQVLSTAKTGDSQIYYSSWNFKSKDLNNDGRLKSFLGTNPQLPTIFDGGPMGITVRTPGPSSLLVFAIGGLPALGALRYRRRARTASRS